MPACAAVGTACALAIRILICHAELIRSIMQIDTALTLCAVCAVDAVEQRLAVFACNAPHQLRTVSAVVAPGTIRAAGAVCTFAAVRTVLAVYHCCCRRCDIFFGGPVFGTPLITGTFFYPVQGAVDFPLFDLIHRSSPFVRFVNRPRLGHH